LTLPTDYTYDAGAKLASVNMDGSKPDGISTNQRRFLTYDGRDALIKEALPELNDGVIKYTYNSFGHMLTKEYGNSRTRFDLAYSYDFAGRNRTVVQMSTGNLMTQIDYFVNTNNDDCGYAGYARGKPKVATRFNFT